MATQQAGTDTKPKSRLSLSSLILIGIVAGIGCGLLLGEYCAWLKVLGDAFIGLLQMSVLPYIMVSLVVNIGRLSLGEGRRLAGRSGLILALLWVIAALAVVIAPFALPEFRAGSFFSTAILQSPPNVDFVGMYIPVNPFASLAESVVPAVVVFSIFFGVALIGIEKKQALLDQLDIILEALTRINTIIVRVTPVGVFAIVASIAGTLTLDELDRLRAYFIIYTASALILSFWLLPMLVAAVTPFSYRQVVSVSRDAVMTAFATGKLFVVLPMLIEASNRLFSELPAEDKEKTTSASVLVPLAYPFPSIGKLLGLFFVPFAAWYVGSALPLDEYPALIVAGIVSFFGSPLAAVPFLLDVARVPADMFNLFIVSGVYCARLGDAVGAVHLLTFSVLTTCALTGRLRFRVTRLLGFGLVTVVLLGVSIGTIRMTLSAVARDAVEMEPALNRMRFNGSAVSHSVLEIAERNPDAFVPGESRLQRIQRRGILRVGFDSEALPFAFFNADGELVGFDVELAHQLAVDLGVEIEFVPFRQESLEGQLADDHFDVAMSGIASDFHTINRMHMVESRIDLTPALVVPDHLRDEFSSLDAIRDVGEVRFGFVGDVQFSERFFRRLPDVEVIPLESARTWFDGGDEEIVGLITTAEAGYAWTMLYPSFHVVIPAGARSKEPHAFAIARDDADFAFFLDHWASLNKKTGAIDVLYAHWILGKGAEEYEPRWSVVRDVLGWGTKE